MLNRMLKKMKKEKDPVDLRELLLQEKAEIEAVAQAYIERIEKQMALLLAAEKRIDHKREALERLIACAGELCSGPEFVQESRRRKVLVLAEKGLKIDDIAEILDISRGEIELILNLGG